VCDGTTLSELISTMDLDGVWTRRSKNGAGAQAPAHWNGDVRLAARLMISAAESQQTIQSRKGLVEIRRRSLRDQPKAAAAPISGSGPGTGLVGFAGDSWPKVIAPL
jgi:hypothetical protein